MKKEPRIVVSAIIRKGRELLLTKELLESKRERWVFPGGGVKFGESLEDALKREIREELGMKIKLEKFIGFKEAIFPNVGYHTVIFFFLAEPLGDFSIREKKILEARYFDFEEIENLDLTDSAKWAFERLKAIEI